MTYTKLILKTLFLPLSLILFISACGSSDSGSDNNTPVQGAIEVPIETCSEVVTNALTQIESGDTLVAEDANTSVKLTHNEDDSKYVCIVAGKAHLLR